MPESRVKPIVIDRKMPNSGKAFRKYNWVMLLSSVRQDRTMIPNIQANTVAVATPILINNLTHFD
jgi:hypothetical protein